MTEFSVFKNAEIPNLKPKDNPKFEKGTSHDILMSSYVLKFSLIIVTHRQRAPLHQWHVKQHIYRCEICFLDQDRGWTSKAITQLLCSNISEKSRFQSMWQEHSENTRKYFKALITEKKLTTVFGGISISSSSICWYIPQCPAFTGSDIFKASRSILCHFTSDFNIN